MTNAELSRQIRKPGKIYGDIHHAHDTMRIQLQKSDVLFMIGDDDQTAVFELIVDAAGNRLLTAAE